MGLYLVIGILIGILVASLSCLIFLNIHKKREVKAVEERNQVIKSIAEIWADIDTLVTSYRSGLVKETGFKTSLTSKLEEINKIFKPNMHILDLYYVKYVERLFHDYTLVAHGKVAQFQFEDKPGLDSDIAIGMDQPSSIADDRSIISHIEQINSSYDVKLESDISSIESGISRSEESDAVESAPNEPTQDVSFDENDAVIVDFSKDSNKISLDDSFSEPVLDSGMTDFEKEFQIQQDELSIESDSSGDPGASLQIEQDESSAISIPAQNFSTAQVEEMFLGAEPENTTGVSADISSGKQDLLGTSVPEVSGASSCDESAEEFCIELNLPQKSGNTVVPNKEFNSVSQNSVDSADIFSNDSVQGSSTQSDISENSFQNEFKHLNENKFDEDFAMETIMDLDMGKALNHAAHFKDDTQGNSIPFSKAKSLKNSNHLSYLGKSQEKDINDSEHEQLGGALQETIMFKPGLNGGEPVIISKDQGIEDQKDELSKDAHNTNFKAFAQPTKNENNQEDNKDIAITGDDVADKLDSFFRI